MVQRLLRLPEPPAPDAADALALALTFAQENGRYSLTRPRECNEHRWSESGVGFEI